MKKIFLLFFLPIFLIASCAWAKKPEYHLTVCAIFKNEAPFLKQWIDFHHQAIGVSHFYLYNNDSTDNFQEVLDPYIEQGLVELIEWHTSYDHAVFGVHDYLHVPYQLAAYRDCLKNRAWHNAEWVAMIDIDEYIVPAKNVSTLYDLLEKSKKSQVGSLKVHLKTFGTSDVQSLDPGDRLVEKLVRRCPDEQLSNVGYMKSIHQPKAAFRNCGVHEVHGIEKGYQVQQVPTDVCRIHHYWSGTEKQCDEKRIFKNPEERKNWINYLNMIEDFSIYPYLDNLSSVN